MTDKQNGFDDRPRAQIARVVLVILSGSLSQRLFDVRFVCFDRRLIRILALVQQLRISLAQLIQRDALIVGNSLELIPTQFVAVTVILRFATAWARLIYHRSATMLFMNARPSRANWSSLLYMRRQIFVAATSSGRARPKASIIR